MKKSSDKKSALPPPRNFEELKDHVAAGQSGLPKRLAQAAQFALSHPDDIALGTAASIAEAANVQPSTLVRLARHFGYDGFSDLQSVFRDRLKNRASTYEERLRKIETGLADDSFEGALLGGFLTAAKYSIESLSEAINPVDFSRCVNLLADADTIYVVAKRRAYPLAAHMSYMFAKLKIKSVTIDTANGIDAEIVGLVGSGDAAIACSFSPYTPATVEQARMLNEQGVPLVAITDSALSPLAACASHWLEVSENDFAGFRSISASMALVLALTVAVAERRRFRI